MTRVLVVEDEESFSDALSFMLRREGYEGGVAADGASALDEFDHLAVLARHAEVTGVTTGPDADRRAFQEHFEVATGHWTTAGADGGYPEPYDDFVARARRALAAAAGLPGPTAVVTSGGVIAALAASLVVPEGGEVGPVWARFNTVIANTSLTRVIVGATGARLLTFNEHPHLPRDLVTYR